MTQSIVGATSTLASSGEAASTATQPRRSKVVRCTSTNCLIEDFLLAMAKDDGPSRMKDIQQRLEIDANFASQYRLRLIASELIEPTRHGYVDFALPYLRDYLREHAAVAGLGP